MWIVDRARFIAFPAPWGSPSPVQLLFPVSEGSSVFAQLVPWAFVMQNQYLVGEDCIFGLVVEGRIWVYRMLICIIKRKRKYLKGISEAVEVGRLEKGCLNFC